MSSSNIETRAELQLRVEGYTPTQGASHWQALKRDAHFTNSLNRDDFNDCWNRYMELTVDIDWIGHWL